MNGALPPRQVKKPWGRDTLSPPFVSVPGERIGEICFEPPHKLSQLLVKYIFTSEKLSIQVHPSGAQARAAGAGIRGKDECWLILDAQMGASLGIGFAEEITADAMQAAALDGSIEARMNWYPVEAGDFFYIPAGTVHAIGAGISLIEVQQNCDITYRLFDYGRPRQLHLQQGVEVAHGAPYDTGLRKHVPLLGTMRLVDGPVFRLDQVTGESISDVAGDYSGPLLIVPRDLPVRIGEEQIAAGGCGIAESLDDLALHPSGTYLIAQPCNA